MSERKTVNSVPDSGVDTLSLNSKTGIEPSLGTASVTPRQQDGVQMREYSSSDVEDPNLSFNLPPGATNPDSSSPANRPQSGDHELSLHIETSTSATPDLAKETPQSSTRSRTTTDGDHELSLHLETPTSATPDLATETSRSSTRSRTTTDGSENATALDAPQSLSETIPPLLGSSTGTYAGVGDFASVNLATTVDSAPVNIAAAGCIPTSPTLDLQRPQSHDDRARTFKAMGELETELCFAGFYRDGKVFRCRSCPLVIKSDRHTCAQIMETGAWEVHARDGPDCKYLLEVRGAEFIKECEDRSNKAAATEMGKPEKISISAGTQDCINQSIGEQELTERFGELRRRIDENDRSLNEKFDETNRQCQSLGGRMDETNRSLNERMDDTNRQCQSLGGRMDETNRSLNERMDDMDIHSTQRTGTLRQDLDGVKTEVDIMKSRQQASDVNARTNERENSERLDVLELGRYVDRCKATEEQQKLDKHREETDGRFQDFAGANNTVVTAQPPPPDVQPEPTTPVTFAVDDGSEADAEVTDVQPAPESNPGNR